MDPSDVLRYTGSTAMIIHTQSVDELKFRLRMNKTKSKVQTPFTLKWQHIIGHFDNFNHHLKKHQTMSDAIDKIASTLKQVAINNGSETSLNRLQFISTCSLISYFDGISEKQLSQLFSLFDPMKKNSIRFIEVLLPLIALDCPEAEPILKIQTLWRYINSYGLDRNIFDLCYDILTTCVGSIDDLTAIDKQFKEVFRPKAYDFAIQDRKSKDEIISISNQIKQMTNIYETPTVSRGTNYNSHNNSSNASVNGGGDRLGTAGTDIHSQPPLSPKSSSGGGGKHEHENPFLNGTGNSAGETSKKSSYFEHQYNICEHYLNEDTLALILKECPDLLQLFDNQLSAKLRLCYGKDDRYKLEEENIPSENLDFTWIIKKAPKVKASFGLFEEQQIEED
jgi:hypothetical protein